MLFHRKFIFVSCKFLCDISRLNYDSLLFLSEIVFCELFHGIDFPYLMNMHAMCIEADEYVCYVQRSFVSFALNRRSHSLLWQPFFESFVLTDIKLIQTCPTFSEINVILSQLVSLTNLR